MKWPCGRWMTRSITYAVRPPAASSSSMAIRMPVLAQRIPDTLTRPGMEQVMENASARKRSFSHHRRAHHRGRDANIAAARRCRRSPAPRWRAVADAAERAPRCERVEVAGPELADLRELAGIWRSVTGHRVTLELVAPPGRLGRAAHRGADRRAARFRDAIS